MSQGDPLSKEQRKDLLASLESPADRAERPEEIQWRAEESLREGRLEQARRLIRLLETMAPSAAGLSNLKERLQTLERQEQLQANLRKTEEMLGRYIQQRKKQLAEFALSTLLEIAPNHPRRQEYEIWVRDLDKEVVLQQRLDEQIQAGRQALRRGDFATAANHLTALRKVDPMAQATDDFAAEIESVRQGQAEGADIRRHKEAIDGLIATSSFGEASTAIDELSKRDVPKITLDFLRKRLAESQGRARDENDAQQITQSLEAQIAAQQWQLARETARRYGDRFPASSRAADLFNLVAREEATERRKVSVNQGIQALEGFLAAGKKHEAALALKLLQNLNLGAEQLADLERRVKSL